MFIDFIKLQALVDVAMFWSLQTISIVEIEVMIIDIIKLQILVVVTMFLVAADNKLFVVRIPCRVD